jgi:hypothetical protein
LQTIQSGDVLVTLSLYCNREYDNVDALIVEMTKILSVLLEAIQRTLDLVSCERIVPIYHRAVYDGACKYSVSALFWVFSAALIMGSFGLLMILFRSAYKPTLYGNSYIGRDEDSNYYDDGPQAVVDDEVDMVPYNSGAYSPNKGSHLSNQGGYSPNKSSIYIEDSPGRNSSR